MKLKCKSFYELSATHATAAQAAVRDILSGGVSEALSTRFAASI